MLSVGLMGGTFNPVHYGHLFVAQEALASLSLSKVVFIPNRLPAHKKDDRSVISAYHRLAMLERGISDNPFFTISTAELEREGYSYTFDTVSEFVKKGDFKYTFIAGADSFINYEWYKFDELLTLLESFFVVARPGSCKDDFERKRTTIRLKDKIMYKSIPGLDISSTELRERILSGKPLRYLMPDSVIDYIENHNLYRG